MTAMAEPRDRALGPGEGGGPMLDLRDIHTYYGNIHALQGITIEVGRGEIVTLIGANGAGTLSGGEQQMLAIGRALMSEPRLLLLDEPSLGLAPILVQQVFATIKEINAQGTTILLVEQNALQALTIAHRGYVLQTGKVVLTGAARDLIKNETVRKAYLGES
jgi:ABC-type branched-subunit amino acid transport system ATPase component